ncbi:MAG: outer membrane beta-barrel protein [Bacteroides sp.]|nr:outer membrane beta-barrel protein [Bacteroides sp.]
MKKVVLGILMTLVMLSATAQESEKKSRWGLRFTADAMLNDSYTGTYNSDGAFLNFNWTLLYQCFVKDNWFVEPQFSVYHMKYKYGEDIFGGITAPSYLKELGGSVAVMAGYNFPLEKGMSLDVFLGPDFKYAFQCENEKGESYIKDEAIYNRAYLAWKAGVGLNWKALNVTLSGGTYLTNRLKGTEGAKTPYFLSLGIGFRFHGKP